MKKVLSILLTVVMVCGLMSVPAFAVQENLIFSEPTFVAANWGTVLDTMNHSNAKSYIRASVDVTNDSDQNQDFNIILAYYAQDELQTINVSPDRSIAKNSRQNYVWSVDTGNDTSIENRLVKVYVWSDMLGIRPLSKSFSLNALSNAKKITDFHLAEEDVVTAQAVIDESDRVIRLYTPKDAALSALTPIIAVSDGASVSPASGVAVDATQTVTYTVTAADGSQTQYKLEVYPMIYDDGDFEKYIDSTTLARFGTTTATKSKVAATDSTSVFGNGRAIHIVADASASLGLNLNFATVASPLPNFSQIALNFKMYQAHVATGFMIGFVNKDYQTVFAPLSIDSNGYICGRANLISSYYYYGNKDNSLLTSGIWQNISIIYNKDSGLSKLYVNGVYAGSTYGGISEASVDNLIRVQFKTMQSTPETADVWLDDITIGVR